MPEREMAVAEVAQDYSKLTDREIDALVAEKLFQYVLANGPPISEPRYIAGPGLPFALVPNYSSSDHAARLVRNRIAELGLHGPFLKHLDFSAAFDGDGTIGFIQQCEWLRMQATPRQQCEAALRALDGKEPK
jgi:hypothetical protein